MTESNFGEIFSPSILGLLFDPAKRKQKPFLFAEKPTFVIAIDTYPGKLTILAEFVKSRNSRRQHIWWALSTKTRPTYSQSLMFHAIRKEWGASSWIGPTITILSNSEQKIILFLHNVTGVKA